MFGIPAVVAINAFPTDTPAEVEAIREVALAAGARDAVVATHFVDGGQGATALAEAVWAAAEDPTRAFRLLYPDEAPLGEKIDTIATEIYGADGIELTPAAQKSLKLYEALGFGHLPVCMAKTQYSLSHDANLKGRPAGFTVPIREIRLSAGAGFITPLCGEMRTMPGLPSGRAARTSTSTRTGTSSGCSRLASARRRGPVQACASPTRRPGRRRPPGRRARRDRPAIAMTPARPPDRRFRRDRFRRPGRRVGPSTSVASSSIRRLRASERGVRASTG